MTFNGFPFNIGWEFTLACNMRCNHCGSSAGLPRHEELTTKEALKLCDQFPDLLVQEIDFTGGEALLRDDWVDIAQLLKDLGISINMLTNGFALGHKEVSKMQEVNVANVGISLDGLKRTHDLIRGRKGSYDRVIKSIEMINRANLPLVVITTVNALNLKELPAMLQLLKSIGVRRWRLQPIIPIGRAKNSLDFELSNQGILELGYFIKEWRVLAKSLDLEIILADGLEYIDDGFIQERQWRGCPAGLITCGITSDGKVKGCLSLPDGLEEGDLRKNDLWDIWFNPRSFAYTRNFSLNELGTNCISCDKSLECKGGCSSDSYASTGHFHDSPYCFYKINKGA